MAKVNLTDAPTYLDFSNSVGYELRDLRARAIATRALLENENGYDSSDSLCDLGFLVTSLAKDLERLARKLENSAQQYTGKEVQHA